MADFATLVLAADSRSLKAGERDLDSIGSTAERTERRVNKATDNMAKGFTAVGRQSTYANGQMRATSMQLSQVAQQASVTGDWLQAIAVQLPDLALALGPVGILAGAAAGALLPLVANLAMTQEEAADLAEKIKALEAATQAYEEAVSNASLSAKDLVDRFGEQAEGAQRAYQALRQLRELEYGDKLRQASDAIQSSLQDIEASVDRFQTATLNFLPREAIMAAQQETQYLAREFGLTAIQAHEITNALNELERANGPREVADAALNLSNMLKDAADEGAKLPPSLRDVQKEALRTYLEASRFEKLLGTANDTAATLAGTMGSVANEANRAANNIAAAIDAQRTKAVIDQLGPLNTLNAFERTPFQDEMQLQNERANNTKSLYQLEAEREAKRNSRSANSEAKRYERERQAVSDLIDELKEELSLVGATETAKRSAAAIRQAGAAATDQEREAIASLITQIDAEQEARDRQIDTMEEYKDSVGSVLDDIRSAMDDGKITWDEWADIALNALDKVIQRIQDDLLNALFSVENMGSGGGGGGFLSSLFGGLFGGGTGGFAKLPSVGPVPIARPSFDGGGYTGSGSRTGGLDGKGGFWAMMHPDETVIDHTKGQSATSQLGGTSEVLVSLSPELVGQILEQAQGQTVKIVSQNNKNQRNLYQNGQAQDG